VRAAWLCACASWLCGRCGGTAGTGGINSSAVGGGGGSACAVAVLCASAAGVTWTSRTLSAQWAARAYHTSVVDAAGAIFVLGGLGGSGTRYKDVWVSTDGGARAGLARGGGSGVHQGGTSGGY
jgi:hypothetical protein